MLSSPPSSVPRIFAHRGASGSAPENTLAAFAAARAAGADGVELDVQLSADDALMVCHDFEVDGHTNGHGPVRGLTRAALQALDAGSWFDAQYAGERIPTLAEVFDLLGRDLSVNIELKTIALSGDPVLARGVVDLIQARDLYAQVIVSSFNPLALLRVRALDERVPLGLICASEPPLSLATILRPWVRPRAMHPEHTLVDARYMAWARRHGYAVNVWTVNTEADARRMAALGVETILSDHPAQARAWVGRTGG